MSNQVEIPNLIQWLTDETPEPKWLIKDLLPESSLAMMSGPRKVAFKTWTAFDWSIAVACGLKEKVLNCEHDGYRVLAFEEEGTAHDTRARWLKLLKAHGLDPRTDLGNDMIKRLMKNYNFMHHPRVKLDNPKWVEQIVSYIKGEGVKLLVLDAITYMTSADENSKQGMQPVNDALFQFRAAGAATLYLVHTNKQAQREDADPDLDVRGSSVLLDAYDVHFALRRHHKDYISMLARYRDFEEVRYRVGWSIDKTTAVCDMRVVSDETEARDRLEPFVKQLVPGFGYTSVSLGKAMGIKTPKEAVTLLNSLIDMGVLQPGGNGTFIKPKR